MVPTRFSLVRMPIRYRVAGQKSLLRNSGVGGGGQIRIPIFLHKESFQRVLIGGLDPWDVGSANSGAPHFLPPICRKTLVLKGFGEILRQKWGAPNLQIQCATDPTPHLKPSDLLRQFLGSRIILFCGVIFKDPHKYLFKQVQK